jgi:hypothetical protein
MKLKRQRMYAVSADGLGLIAGTLSYSRRDAIMHFQGSAGILKKEWEESKRAGYRTVQAVIEITGRFGTKRTTRR